MRPTPQINHTSSVRGNQNDVLNNLEEYGKKKKQRIEDSEKKL